MEKGEANLGITNGEVKEQIKNIILKYREQRRAICMDSDTTLKRTPYDSLEEKGMLNADSILTEYNLIKEKKCELSSNERSFIVLITSIAAEYVFVKKVKAYQKAKEELADAEKPKKRTRKEKQ